jgi:hypothetical protein
MKVFQISTSDYARGGVAQIAMYQLHVWIEELLGLSVKF